MLRPLVFVCLCLIALALRAQTSPPAPFTNVTTASGIVVPPITLFNGFGRGGAWDDFDGDGDMDFFAPGGAGNPIWMFWNNGNGTFTQATLLANPPVGERHLAAVSADFDNDGDQDVYLCIDNGPNRLFVNQGGGGVFFDGAIQAGVALAGTSYAASWGDYDRDGWLDLYVGNFIDQGIPGADANTLYRNLGNGTFSDVSVSAGANAPGAALSVCWHDVDQDGWPDIHVGNDRGDVGPPNALLHNKRHGFFVDESAVVNANAPIGCMGITVGDLHNDGDWDVFLSNYQVGHVLLEWSPAIGQYLFNTDWYGTAGLYGLQTNQIGWGCKFFDYNCDGINDLFIANSSNPNRLFRGTGLASTPMIDDSFARNLQVALPGGEACCTIDYDDDGDLDIFMPGRIFPAQLAQNPGPDANWIRFDLEGTISNRDAFGAVVICRSALGEQRRMKTSGESFLADGDKRIHFGLGADSAVTEVEFRWPSGTVSYLHNLTPNQTLSVVEPKFQVLGSMQPGTINQVSLTLPSDGGLPYLCGVTVDTSVQTPLGDGRFLRFNLFDPIYQATTTPGNWDFTSSMGTLDGNGTATMHLFLPPFPYLSGFPIYFVGGTGAPGYAWGLKSLVAPNKYYIQ